MFLSVAWHRTSMAQGQERELIANLKPSSPSLGICESYLRFFL